MQCNQRQYRPETALAWLALSEDPAEVYAAVPQVLQNRHHITGGAFYARLGDWMALVVQWGSEKRASSFQIHECRSLRPLHVQLSCNGQHCPHLQGSGPHLCIPVMGSIDVRGVLVLDGLLEESALESIEMFAEALGAALETAQRCQMLRHQATYDGTLGIYNRPYFERRTESVLARAAFDHNSVGLIYLDLDNFKKYNDRFGHLKGNLLLEQVGAMLQAVVRGEDFPARWGGEELVLVLPGVDAETVGSRAELLRESMKALPQVPNESPVTVSIGISMFPQDGVTVKDLVAAADAALYRAKSGGRDRVEFAHIQ